MKNEDGVALLSILALIIIGFIPMESYIFLIITGSIAYFLFKLLEELFEEDEKGHGLLITSLGLYAIVIIITIIDLINN